MNSSSHWYYVDEYAPDEYHEIGDNIIIPVYVKIFPKKTKLLLRIESGISPFLTERAIGHSFAVQQQFNLPCKVQIASVLYPWQELRPPAVNISDF